MNPTTTHNGTGESGLQALIAKHKITMTSQHLGPNAIDSKEDQWLLTLRRGDGRIWMTRFYGTTEDVRAALKAAESAEIPACAEILELMYQESQYDVADFNEFFAEYYSDAEQVPSTWDRMFHQYVVQQTEGLERFMEGIDLPEE